MTADPTVYTKLFAFSGALSVLAMAGSWWRKGSPHEDDVVVEAADLVLGALSDADDTRGVELVAGRNWRDDVTIEEAIEMRREADLRRMQNRN